MSDIQHRRSLWIGALCSTLAPPVLVVLIALLARPRITSAGRLLSGIGGVFAIATPVSFAATLCLLPLVVLLRRFNALTWFSICSGAAIIGAAAFPLFGWLIAGKHHSPNLFEYSFGAFVGFVSGAAFSAGVGPAHSIKSNPPGES